MDVQIIQSCMNEGIELSAPATDQEIEDCESKVQFTLDHWQNDTGKYI